MNVAQRKRAEELFQQAVDLPPEQRTFFVAQASEGDDNVHAEVLSLLEHYDEGTLTSLHELDLAEHGAARMVGETIGPYTLVQLLGEGGFGAVYRAVQEVPVRREVALKIIKLGMDTRQVIARFEMERQALALMDHPHIAKVLDAGATTTGRPYFVMELVRGVPITQYCDEHRLTVAERLELFMQVCQAVQHAHQKGIIHRDLKPSNVLVTMQDGHPAPKVIDFGIAKATGARLTELTLLTNVRQLVGTPAYMSPEQAEMSGVDVDTRSDIYSLGVLLYELLTGTTPFDPETLRSASYIELQRMIREAEPARPSVRLTTREDSRTTAARLRQIEPRALVRHLRGDLDWIVMRAMEKDRTRRYATAAGFAADIRRHLDAEPVVAGPPGARYRLCKFVWRHRIGVAAGGFVTAGLLIGCLVATVALLQARRERDAADAAAARAQAISRFLESMLASADPLQLRQLSAFAPPEALRTLSSGGLPRDVSVAQMVRRASANIGTVFAGKPELEADARETVGMTLRGLGVYADAEPHLQRAFTLRRDLLGERHPDTLRVELALGALLLDMGRAAEAQRYVRAASLGMQVAFGLEDPRTLSCSCILASVYSSGGDFESADSMFKRTLHQQQEVLGPEHRDALMTMWSWSVASLSHWRLAEGEELARQLHEIAQRTLEPDDSLNILSRPLMGWWYVAHYRYDQAEAVLRPGLADCRRILGETHPFTYMTMHGLARALQGAAVQDEKERLYHEALDGLVATRGRLHRHTISARADLARWLVAKGQWDAARMQLGILIEDSRAAFGRDDENTQAAILQLADLLEASGRLDDSLALRELRLTSARARNQPGSALYIDEAQRVARALVRVGRVAAGRAATQALLDQLRTDMERTQYPLLYNNYAWVLLTCVPRDLRDPNAALHYATIAAEGTKQKNSAVLDTLALAYDEIGQSAHAVEIQRHSLELLQPGAGRDLTYGANLVRFLLRAGERTQAEQFVYTAIDMFRAALGQDNPRLADEYQRAGIWLSQSGHAALAEALFTEALELNRSVLGPDHEQVALSLTLLADINERTGDYGRATELYRQALDLQLRLYGPRHIDVARTYYALGETLYAQGQLPSAETDLRAALRVYEQLGAADVPAVWDVQRALAEVLLARGQVTAARPLAEDVLAKLQTLYGPAHVGTATALQTLGRIQLAQGDAPTAETTLRVAVAAFEQLDADDDARWRTALARSALGECLTKLGNWDAAEPLLLDSYDVLRAERGVAFAGTRRALARVIAFCDATGRTADAARWRVLQGTPVLGPTDFRVAPVRVPD